MKKHREKYYVEIMFAWLKEVLIKSPEMFLMPFVSLHGIICEYKNRIYKY